MAKNNNLGDFLKGIANKFRSKLGTADTINPQNFEDKIDAVYDAAAQKAYDDFWDAFQENGSRTDYFAAFSGKAWTDSIFKPKYDIVVDVANTYSGTAFEFMHQNKLTDVIKLLNDQNVSISFKNIGDTKNIIRLLYDCSEMTTFPILDFRSVTSGKLDWIHVAAMGKLHTIGKFYFPETTDVTLASGFMNSIRNLKNITFCNTCKTTVWFKDNPLSADSVKSLLDHLDTADSDSERTVTIKTASKTAYDEKYGDWDAKVAEFAAHSWTFALV